MGVRQTPPPLTREAWQLRPTLNELQPIKITCRVCAGKGEVIVKIDGRKLTGKQRAEHRAAQHEQS